MKFARRRPRKSGSEKKAGAGGARRNYKKIQKATVRPERSGKSKAASGGPENKPTTEKRRPRRDRPFRLFPQAEPRP